MTDITVDTSITAGVGARTGTGTLGATTTAGQFVYRDPADMKLKLADANGATAVPAEAVGLLLTGGGDGSPCFFVEEGPVEGYTGVKPGQVYVLSNTAGSMCLESDLTEDTSYLTVVAVGLTTTSIYVRFIPSGVKVNLV